MKLVVVGAGGHGAEIVSYIEALLPVGTSSSSASSTMDGPLARSKGRRSSATSRLSPR